MLTCLGLTAQSNVEDAVYLNKPNRTLQKYNKSQILLLQNFFMYGLFQVMTHSSYEEVLVYVPIYLNMLTAFACYVLCLTKYTI